MSGFFVGNSLGTFNSKNAESKVFNATLIDIPGAPATATFRQIYSGWPQIPSIGYSWDWGMAGANAMRLYHDKKSVSGSPESKSGVMFPWGDDSVILEEDKHDGMTYKPHKDTIAKITVKAYSDGKKYNYAAGYFNGEMKSGTTTLKSAAQSTLSKWDCVKNYQTGVSSGGQKWAAVDVYLDGSDGDYVSVDIDDTVSGIASFRLKLACGDFKDPKRPELAEINKMAITLRSITWSKAGCKDASANNTTPGATKDDGSCTFTTSPITSFTAAPSSFTVGTKVKLSWALANGNFSEVKILDDNDNNIMESGKKTAQNSSMFYTPTMVGTNSYKLVVSWIKPNSGSPEESATITVSSATSYILCTDPNRATTTNGECAAGCNSGYYLDGATGLCSTCTEPNRAKNTSTGKCTTCLAGYAEHTDGSCQKVGCMTYTDGTSASDDYNYDSDAIVNDSSLCETPDGPANSDISGCMDNTANNYSDTATLDDSSCTYDEIIPDVDCELSAWSEWTEWSTPAVVAATDVVAVAESGTRTRSRTVVTASSGTGAVCEHLEETETKDPETGKVVITTAGGGSTTTTTTTTTPSSPVIPIMLGVAGLGVLALLMRR
jgi:hypothetical protein